MTKRIFITGGASGLGRALALHCARAGFRVFICDLNSERGHETLAALRANGAEDAAFLKLDVRSESELQEARNFLEMRWGGVDVVVNNAGVAQSGKIDLVPLEDWEWILDINLLGVVRGCRTFTPLFKKQGHGHFINIASMAGLLEGPRMAAYSVSKAGVVKLSEVLDMELASKNIKISVVCPAFFPTNLTESLRTTSPGSDQAIQRAFQRSPITCEQVAYRIFEAIQEPRFWILPHNREKYLWWVKCILPQAWYKRVLAFLIEKFDPKPKT
jgi:NAD(P)-dependent dehydrogenase (short-subunit alcohol dehydrogenase family)